MKGGGGCGHCSVSRWCTKAVVFIDMNNANGNGVVGAGLEIDAAS